MRPWQIKVTFIVKKECRQMPIPTFSFISACTSVEKERKKEILLGLRLLMVKPFIILISELSRMFAEFGVRVPLR